MKRFREKLKRSTNRKKKKKTEGGDLDQTGNKTRGDKANSKRCLEAANPSKRQSSHYRGKVGGIVCQDARQACSPALELDFIEVGKKQQRRHLKA